MLFFGFPIPNLFKHILQVLDIQKYVPLHVSQIYYHAIYRSLNLMWVKNITIKKLSL